LGYDERFVNDYLKSVYDTNLAAIESAAVSKMVIARASSALAQIDQKIFIERQELNSVLNRLNRIGRESPISKDSSTPNEVSRQKDLATEKIETLKLSIAAHEEDRASFRQTNLLALRTTANANQVGSSTFELCAHAFKLCKDGVFRIDKPTKAFIISRKFIFTPCTKPVDESDFFKPEVEGHKYNEFAASVPVKQKANSCVVFLTTDALLSPDLPKPIVSNSYPFGNIRIPSGQLFYYCKDAIRTGTSPKVTWSVVIRDLIASTGQNNSGMTTGEPIQSDRPDWCKVPDQNGCPGLACEFQLRTPLPAVSGSSETSLTNPTSNAQIPQMPPVPADML
jgi:hypothetical protein